MKSEHQVDMLYPEATLLAYSGVLGARQPWFVERCRNAPKTVLTYFVRLSKRLRMSRDEVIDVAHTEEISIEQGESS